MSYRIAPGDLPSGDAAEPWIDGGISADGTPLTGATRRGSSQWVRTLLDIGRLAPVS
jgi:hypothetical protein